ncbi:hypothetical protein HOH45_01755 [bacterium]|nr:hypothetical protein [bacterium]
MPFIDLNALQRNEKLTNPGGLSSYLGNVSDKKSLEMKNSIAALLKDKHGVLITNSDKENEKGHYIYLKVTQNKLYLVETVKDKKRNFLFNIEKQKLYMNNKDCDKKQTESFFKKINSIGSKLKKDELQMFDLKIEDS